MRIDSLMTREIAAVEPDTSLKEVAALLTAFRISGVPVIRDGRVVGVVSMSDIVWKEQGNYVRRGRFMRLLDRLLPEDARKLEARTAGDAMTSPAVTIAVSRHPHEAARLMISAHVNRLPVVDGDGALVGILTRTDLVRAFARSDDELEHQIRNDIVFRTFWIDPGRIHVSVDDGVVSLSGRVENEALIELIPTVVGQIPGVVAVESRLSYAA